MFEDILHIFYPRSYTLGNGKQVKEKFNPFPYLLILFIGVVIGLSVFTRVDFVTMFKRGDNFFDIVRAMIPPNWNYWSTMEKAMLDTINMSLLGSVFGCAVALPVSFYLASNFQLNKIYLVTHRLALSLLRTLPILVMAFFFRTVLGIGALAGTLAISVFSYTICVKMMYEYIETLDMGAYEALESTGASRLRCILSAIWPQVKGFFLSTFLYCFETNVKSAAILGFVGAGGLGQQMDNSMKMFNGGEVATMLLVFMALVALADRVSAWLRKVLG